MGEGERKGERKRREKGREKEKRERTEQFTFNAGIERQSESLQIRDLTSAMEDDLHFVGISPDHVRNFVVMALAEMAANSSQNFICLNDSTTDLSNHQSNRHFFFFIKCQQDISRDPSVSQLSIKSQQRYLITVPTNPLISFQLSFDYLMSLSKVGESLSSIATVEVATSFSIY